MTSIYILYWKVLVTFEFNFSGGYPVKGEKTYILKLRCLYFYIFFSLVNTNKDIWKVWQESFMTSIFFKEHQLSNCC